MIDDERMLAGKKKRYERERSFINSTFAASDVLLHSEWLVLNWIETSKMEFVYVHTKKTFK